jgi:multiple sugar transport system substrate-binding protein
MARINLSICGDATQNNPVLHQMLETFQKGSTLQTQVEVHPIPWDSYRQELTSMVIHNQSGDVAQAGAPVASDMMAMNALRRFRPREVEQMGGKDAFVPIVWKNIPPSKEGEIWAIPWLADPRIFFYWRDLVEEAQADEKTAFENPQNIIETMKRLQKNGVAHPWGITVGNKHSALHTVASWVWASGGEFLSEDEKKALILEPRALEGLKAYFSMAAFMAPECLTAGYQKNNENFINRRSAVIMGNCETLKFITEHTSPEMRARLGAALPFGVPLVGGSDLMIWASTRHEEQAVSLVQFLAGAAFQSVYPMSIDHLPVRREALENPPHTTDPLLKIFTKAMYKGRIFPVVRLSGLFEERLGNALINIWNAVFADPAADLETLITDNLFPVVRQYDNWMLSS